MKLGLRTKSALALGICIVVVLALAIGAGWLALRSVEENLGTAYARNVTQYNKQRVLTPVLRDLALAQRLADAQVTRAFLLDENDPQKRAAFFAEAERYRQAFDDNSYFLISALSNRYYFNDDKTAFSPQVRYSLDKTRPNDQWFFSSMRDTKDYNINVDPDVHLKVTKVWFNVVVTDQSGKRRLGLAGSGLDLTEFLNRFIANSESGVTPMILNPAGAIQAHPNKKLIDYASINDKGSAHSTIFRLLPEAEDRAEFRQAMQRAERDSEQIQAFWVDMGGSKELFAVSYVPELQWHVVTSVDLGLARVLDTRLWLPIIGTAAVLLMVLLLASIVAVNRIVLSPLLRLTDSAQQVAAGNYSIELPPAGHDEIGQLTRAFGAMATQVRAHTDELEGKVRERTRELTTVNQQMAEVNKKIGDSIRYASLIQSTILPGPRLQRELDGKYFALWRPRDVVGGDYYLMRAGPDGYLMGVVDCAGHGVPGAFMTMVAHSVLDVALETHGPHDPAALLSEIDERIRLMLQLEDRHDLAATHMDMGLAYINLHERQITFAGAKVGLYWCDGKTVGEIKGGRRALGGRRKAEFINQTLPLDHGQTFYLTTDGLLDQAGGEKGYSFGEARFTDLLRREAGQPLESQRAALVSALEAYQGQLPQRDDITVLGFAFS